MIAIAERVVYTSRLQPKHAKRSNGVIAGLHRKCTDGKRRICVNCVTYRPLRGQKKKLGEIWCGKCGHIYTELMVTGEHTCSECQLEALAERSKRLEEAGIPLGWGYTNKYSDIADDHKGLLLRVYSSVDDYQSESAYKVA